MIGIIVKCIVCVIVFLVMKFTYNLYDFYKRFF